MDGDGCVVTVLNDQGYEVVTEAVVVSVSLIS